MFNNKTFTKERKSYIANMYIDLSSQSYKHMIHVLIILVVDKDVIDLHELTSLKQTKKSNN